jgi:hypothetical protein
VFEVREREASGVWDFFGIESARRATHLSALPLSLRMEGFSAAQLKLAARNRKATWRILF